MAQDKTASDALILVRHMAQTGKFKDVLAIEVALVIQGKGELVEHLQNPVHRDELDTVCSLAQAQLAAADKQVPH